MKIGNYSDGYIKNNNNNNKQMQQIGSKWV